MRYLKYIEFCTGGPHPIERIGCGLKMGVKITLFFDWRSYSNPPDAGVEGGWGRKIFVNNFCFCKYTFDFVCI